MESEMSERLKRIDERAEAIGWKCEYFIEGTDKHPHYVIKFWVVKEPPELDDWLVLTGNTAIQAAERLLIPYEEEHAAEAKAKKTLEEIRSKIAAAFESIGLKDRWELVETIYVCPGTGRMYQYAVTSYRSREPEKMTEADYGTTGIMDPNPRTVSLTMHFNEEDMEELIEAIRKYWEVTP